MINPSTLNRAVNTLNQINLNKERNLRHDVRRRAIVDIVWAVVATSVVFLVLRFFWSVT
jgi:hypothetical protein